MKNKLQQYFPMIRSREEIREKIENDEFLKMMFYRWTQEQRQEFLDFCSGAKGVKMMYDFVSKEILNPEYAVPVILQTCCSGNTKESEANRKRNSVIKISNMSIRSFYSRKVLRLFINSLITIYTILNKDQIQVLKLISCKNICLFRLTSSVKLSTIKTEQSGLKTG